jgi:hypothetical protein
VPDEPAAPSSCHSRLSWSRSRPGSTSCTAVPRGYSCEPSPDRPARLRSTAGSCTCGCATPTRARRSTLAFPSNSPPRWSETAKRCSSASCGSSRGAGACSSPSSVSTLSPNSAPSAYPARPTCWSGGATPRRGPSGTCAALSGERPRVVVVTLDRAVRAPRRSTGTDRGRPLRWPRARRAPRWPAAVGPVRRGCPARTARERRARSRVSAVPPFHRLNRRGLAPEGLVMCNDLRGR